MQTGTEEYDVYIARGRGEDRQRIVDLLEERFAEAPGSPEDQIRAGALQRRIYDLPMVWSCHSIAQFLGGRLNEQRTDHTANQSAGYRNGVGKLQRDQAAGHDTVGANADAGGVDGGHADPF